MVTLVFSDQSISFILFAVAIAAVVVLQNPPTLWPEGSPQANQIAEMKHLLYLVTSAQNIFQCLRQCRIPQLAKYKTKNNGKITIISRYMT